jgi:hypothetical protein
VRHRERTAKPARLHRSRESDTGAPRLELGVGGELHEGERRLDMALLDRGDTGEARPEGEHGHDGFRQ